MRVNVRSEVLACEHHNRLGQSDLMSRLWPTKTAWQLRKIMNPFVLWTDIDNWKALLCSISTVILTLSVHSSQGMRSPNKHLIKGAHAYIPCPSVHSVLHFASKRPSILNLQKRQMLNASACDACSPSAMPNALPQKTPYSSQVVQSPFAASKQQSNHPKARPPQDIHDE
jgi:hypothetical protein